VQVRVARADVADEAGMRQVFADMAATLPPLRGVMHAAGVVTYRELPTLTAADLAAELRPKVQGTWVLHELTRALPLEFFVCFSSIAAVWGSKGQGHYAAANQFLDSLAHYRRRLGLPGVSVNWGAWAGPGMVTAEAETFLARLGIESMPPAQALTALGLILAGGQVQTTVCRVAWERFTAVYEARGRRPFLQEMASTGGAEESAPAVVESAWVQALTAAPASQRHGLLQSYVQAAVAQVLGFASSQVLDPQAGFFELGMNSLMAVDLKNLLQSALRKPLSATVAFNYATIETLTGHLAQEVLGFEAPSRAGDEAWEEQAGNARAIEQVQQFSEAELIAKIGERFEAI
jgi:NAD(P)-dependent dehydrogenase (short-subunit alcohol dehydrogenase family)